MDCARGLMNHLNWREHNMCNQGCLGHANDVRRGFLLNSGEVEALGPGVEVER